MRFAEDSQSPFSIQSVSTDGIVIDDRLINHSVLVCAESVQDWPPRDVNELSAEHLSLTTPLGPEIIILGTGSTQVFPPPQVTGALRQSGVGVEIMANDAACRTFNVLLSEDRRVVLALIQARPAAL